jgi:hypothetical protein
LVTATRGPWDDAAQDARAGAPPSVLTVRRDVRSMGRVLDEVRGEVFRRLLPPGRSIDGRSHGPGAVPCLRSVGRLVEKSRRRRLG